MFRTIGQVKAANRAAGQHFFSDGAMRFFRSRIESGLIGGRYFVTSEQFVRSDGVADPREFRIRIAHDDGRVESAGDWQRTYPTLEAAEAAIAGIMSEG